VKTVQAAVACLVMTLKRQDFRLAVGIPDQAGERGTSTSAARLVTTSEEKAAAREAIAAAMATVAP
jgi:hypothetical protein